MTVKQFIDEKDILWWEVKVNGRNFNPLMDRDKEVVSWSKDDDFYNLVVKE